MIAIIDYGMGNLRSVQKAFERVGATAKITDSAEDLKSAEKIVLPGVGAVRPAMEKLEQLNLIDPIQSNIQSGKLFLGICLGFQLLFDKSEEGGESKALGILPGTVKRFEGDIRVPHMGWNTLQLNQTDCALFKNLPTDASVYFCHSYYACPEDNSVTATSTEYGKTFTSSVHYENIYGTQFHPEKSQSIGLNMLKNFTEISS